MKKFPLKIQIHIMTANDARMFPLAEESYGPLWVSFYLHFSQKTRTITESPTAFN